MSDSNDRISNRPSPRHPTFDALRTRPFGAPKTKKDFKKIVNESDPDKLSEEEIAENKEEAPSLFDLSAKKSAALKQGSSFIAKGKTAPSKEEEAQLEQMAQEEAEWIGGSSDLSSLDNKENDADLATKEQSEEGLITSEQVDKETIQAASQDAKILDDTIGKQQIASMTNQRLKSTRPDVLALETDATVPSSKEPKSKLGSSRERFDFAQEKSDLSYVNQAIQSLNLSDDSIADEQDVHSATIRDIVEQIAHTIQTIKSKGQMDTIVTLKQPPILEGAQLVLTSFDADQKNFNIAFTHLSIAAKQFLDQQLTNESLTRALENKGYGINMLTTTTLAEIPPMDVKSEQNFARQEEQRQQQQQQQKQQQQRQQPNKIFGKRT